MLVGGRDDAHGIVDSAKISLICAGVPLSTICTFWPVPSCFKLIFKTLLDYLTGALDNEGQVDNTQKITAQNERYLSHIFDAEAAFEK
jgi:hypothetical protein